MTKQLFSRLNKLIILLTLLWGSQQACAQTFELQGQVFDKAQKPLVGCTIAIFGTTDTTGTTSNTEGQFKVSLSPGSYRVRISYIGFKSAETQVVLNRKNIDLGKFYLEPGTYDIEEYKIRKQQIRAQQKGDTTEYNANAFKVNPDANAEDLVTKMPGVTKENGTVKAQGENVKKVLVDGQEFFGQDATLALQNLPAEIIDKIQVFDQQSDQSQFTGFNDGNTTKTINIVTKPGMSNGQFGRAFAGYGTDDRYAAGSNINLFQGDRRISIIGHSNNINQQNFSTEDLLGVLGTTGQQNNGSGGRRRRRGRFGAPNVSADPNDFLVGQQGGINTSHAIGLNYTDSWGKKIKINGSYFFNQTDNETNQVLSQELFLTEQSSQLYNENSISNSSNYNHRINVRMVYTLDTKNSIIFTPKLSLQNNRGNSFTSGLNRIDGALLNETRSDYGSDLSGYQISGGLTFRHRFSKKGRTFSLGLTSDLSDQNGTSNLQSLNTFYGPPDSLDLIDQRTTIVNNGTTWAPYIFYTEPLGKKSMLMLNYSPSFNQSNAEQLTNQLDLLAGEYAILDSLLSNTFDNTITTQRGGIGYRIRDKKLSLMVRLNYQAATLESHQSFPDELKVKRTFNNLLPMASLRYNYSTSKNLRVFYRAGTNNPSITQLQNIVNNTNPLQLSIGNPELKQENTHMVVTKYGATNAAKGRTFFAFTRLTFTDQSIGNTTLIARADTLLKDGVVLLEGSQLSKPENLGSAWNVSSFMTYGLPVSLLQSNLNINTGLTYSRTPGRINNRLNQANTYNLSTGLVLGSNISQKVDFTLSYAANMVWVDNSLQPELNNNYYYHTAGIKFNWLPWKGFVLNTEAQQTLYSGLGDAFDQDFLLWNAGIGYKFMKDQLGEVRLTVFDLLKVNNNISRNVTETFIEDSETRVLQQYFMLTFSYKLRHFRLQKPSESNTKPQP